MSLRRIPCLLRVCSAFTCANAGLLPLHAQNPAVFVNLSTAQALSGAAPTSAATVTIAAPGSGWTYGAVAPYAGETWNNILAPHADDEIKPQLKGYVRYDVVPLNTANNIALSLPDGSASGVTFTAAAILDDAGTNTNVREVPRRVSPTLGTPAALLNSSWRIFEGGNFIGFTFSGLPAAAHYLVYGYGTTNGAGQGARFQLDASNAVGPVWFETSPLAVTAPSVFVDNAGVIAPSTPAPLEVASNAAGGANSNTTWSVLHAKVSNDGKVILRAGRNASGSGYVNGLQVIPYPKATITTQPPANASGTFGDGVTLTAAASGFNASDVVTYQWRKGGVPISAGSNPSAATASLTLSNLQNADAGSYDVVVTNYGGDAISSATVITVTSGAVAPSITTQPVARTAITGGSANFSVGANGTSPLTYTWQKSTTGATTGFTDLPASNNAALALTGVTVADAGFYRVRVQNSVSTVISDAVSLIVAPVITAQPLGATMTAGAAATLTVGVDVGAGAPEATTYAWKRNGVTVTDGSGITGAATASLQIASFAEANSGVYSVTASNAAGSVTSSVVYLGTATTQSITFAPGNNASGINPDAPLIVRFPSAPRVGDVGRITVRKTSDNSIVETIDLGALTPFTNVGTTFRYATKAVGGQAGYKYFPVLIVGNEARITLKSGSVLQYGTSYYVTIDPGAILDSTGSTLPPITGNSGWTFTTKAAPPASAPTQTTFTVAADGTGDFSTLQGALDFIPTSNTTPLRINIRNGLYTELINYGSRNKITLVGENRDQTIVEYPNNAALNSDTTLRVSFFAKGSDLVFANLTINNSTPKGGSQAEALRSDGLRNSFLGCTFKSFQDTLLLGADNYFQDCLIQGDTDFIWGGGTAMFKNCELRAMNGGELTQARTPANRFGFIFVDCTLTRPAGSSFSYGLGRTSADATNFGNPVFIDSRMDTHISTTAWSSSFINASFTANARNWEYQSRNLDGSALIDVSQRAAISRQLTSTEAATLRNPANAFGTTTDSTPAGAQGNGWVPTVLSIIHSQPASQSVNLGLPVTFSVGANGVSTPTYQWHKNGSPISGATSATLSISSAAAGDAADYTVVLTNAAGSVTSAAATLTVSGNTPAPVFTTHPASQTINTGASATFTAAASGSPTYQWKKDGTDIPGAVSASYTVTNASIGNAGSYTVAATNAGGSVTSNAAVLTVNVVTGPGITTQPVTQTVTVGTAVNFTVAATGTGTLTYQWQKEIAGVFTNVPYLFADNDPTIVTDLSGITTPTLSFVHAQVINAGNYRVLVTDTTGTTASNTVAFTVNAAPVGALTFDGFAGSVTGGGSLTPVVVTTAAALRTSAESSSAAVITVSGVIDLGTSGRINVKSNKTIRGADTGATIIGSLSLSTVTNVIIANLNITARTGGRASNDGLTVGSGSTNVLITKCTFFDCTDGNLDVTNGSDNVTISWCKFYYTRNTTHNFSNLIGSSDDDVATSPYRTTWHHNWWGPGCKQRMLACRFGGAHMFNNYWSCTGNDYCSTSRNIAQLLSEYNVYHTVKDPLAKEGAAKLKTIGNVFTSCTGTQTVSNDTIFTPPYTYRVDRTSDIPTLVTAGAGNVGTAAPAAESLAITGATSVATGGSLTLTASGYISYQWRFNNEPISGATAPTFTIANAQSAHAGVYTVVGGFSGRPDSVVSTPHTLTVTSAPVVVAPSITTQPASQSANIGAAASFTVVATGDAPLTYQWQKETAGTFTNITGATSATLTISTTQWSDAAAYRVVVTNTAGSVTSASATLTVTQPGFAVTSPDGFANATTGGGSATPVTVTTAAALKTAAESTSPAVITVSGIINLSSSGGNIRVKSNKTIQGADTNATIIGNINIGSGVENVILRGLNLTNPGTILGTDGRYTDGGDAVAIEGSKNIFITHCTIFDCADGMIDTRLGADLVTISWCEFYYTVAQLDHRFTMISDGLLIRDPVTDEVISASTPLRITMHHNWWSDRCDQRMPSSTNGHIHLYNNYWNTPGNSYASVARDMAQFFAEHNTYENVNSPIAKSDNNALLANGLIRIIGNRYTSITGTPADPGTDAVFTPAYSYKLQPATSTASLDVKTLVLAHAGNIAGLNSVSPAALSATITGPSTGSAQAVAPGDSTTLTATFTGFTAASYQWRWNNFLITGATSSTYAITAMDASKAGAYTVAITLASGETVISSPFTITLGTATAPTITSQPANVAVTAGGSASFSVVATGSPAPTYQWRKAAADITGATSATYSIAATTASDAAQYTVVVTNSAGSVTSNAATLTVNPAPTPPAQHPSSGGGGGGAPSLWFLGVLSMLVALRRHFLKTHAT